MARKISKETTAARAEVKAKTDELNTIRAALSAEIAKMEEELGKLKAKLARAEAKDEYDNKTPKYRGTYWRINPRGNRAVEYYYFKDFVGMRDGYWKFLGVKLSLYSGVEHQSAEWHVAESRKETLLVDPGELKEFGRQEEQGNFEHLLFDELKVAIRSVNKDWRRES